MPYRDLEPAIVRIGRELQAHVRQRRSVRDRAEQRLLDFVIAEPGARARLFQLVDAFPALRGSAEVSDHIAGYLDHEAVPAAIRHAVRASRRVPGGERISAEVARRGITHMAERFIAGTDATTARPTFERLWGQGMGVIVDLLGEKTITPLDADRYATRVARLIEALGSWPRTGRRSIAIKPTALAPRLHPLTAEVGLAEARDRLFPILRAATAADLLLWFDMEQNEVKDLTLTLFRSLLSEPELAGARTGIVVQAYLRDSTRDLTELLRWSADAGRPFSIRLVKGAYWDAETVLARAHGWPVPVYEHKGDTDASYERGTRLLLEHRAGSHPTVQPAFASHNVRSIAHAIAVSDDLGLRRDDLELQMLYGMEGGLATAARSLGPQVDVYAPIGELVPGMSYLVRRLLENSSNESFVRQTTHEADEARLLAPPVTSGASAEAA
jgi:proline dehydrogenase